MISSSSRRRTVLVVREQEDDLEEELGIKGDNDILNVQKEDHIIDIEEDGDLEVFHFL